MIDILQEFINNHQIDILCLSETRICNLQFEKNRLEGLLGPQFKEFHNFSKIKGYSGVSIYQKDSLEIPKWLEINEQLDCESRILCQEYDKFILVNSYVPNAQSDLKRLDYKINDWFGLFFELFDQLSKSNKQLILCGDINIAHREIDLANPKQNRRSAGFTAEEREKLTEFMDRYKMKDVFRELYKDKVQYTWWSNRGRARERNIGWRIDYFLANQIDNIKDITILDQQIGSDHCPVLLQLD